MTLLHKIFQVLLKPINLYKNQNVKLPFYQFKIVLKSFHPIAALSMLRTSVLETSRCILPSSLLTKLIITPTNATDSLLICINITELMTWPKN